MVIDYDQILAKRPNRDDAIFAWCAPAWSAMQPCRYWYDQHTAHMWAVVWREAHSLGQAGQPSCE